MNRKLHEIVANQKPLAMPAEATVREACKAMHERKVGAVMVTKGDQLAGIFTGRDAVRVLAKKRDPGAAQLKDVMTRDPVCLGPHATAIDALRLMHDQGFRHVPITEEGTIMGIVSRQDFRGLEHDRLDVETEYWERIR